jgi:glyoxylase-like metal-dependent hydrolase (beta-lactamase superfamily II)
MTLYLRQMEIGPMQNFVYLIGDPEVKKCWIVDPAWEVEKALAQAEKDGYSVEGALITHAHFDHCNGVPPLLAAKNIPVYVHKREIEFLDKGAPQGLFGELPKEHLKIVDSGDKISLGATTLRFLHTPGHTPGSQCFMVDNNLISGDTLFLGTCGRSDMPGGNPYELFESLNQRIAPLPDDTVLFPGHNYSSKGVSGLLGQEKKQNRFFQAHTKENFLRLAGF